MWATQEVVETKFTSRAPLFDFQTSLFERWQLTEWSKQTWASVRLCAESGLSGMKHERRRKKLLTREFGCLRRSSCAFSLSGSFLLFLFSRGIRNASRNTRGTALPTIVLFSHQTRLIESWIRHWTPTLAMSTHCVCCQWKCYVWKRLYVRADGWMEPVTYWCLHFEYHNIDGRQHSPIFCKCTRKAKDEQIINSWPISSSPSRWKQSNKIPINPWVDCRWLIFAHSKSYLRTFNDHTKEFLKWLMKQIYFDCESFACNQLIWVCSLYSWIVRSCKWERLPNSIKFHSTSQKHWIMSQLKLPPESSTSQLINQL